MKIPVKVNSALTKLKFKVNRNEYPIEVRLLLFFTTINK